jgi:hypothetical protein
MPEQMPDFISGIYNYCDRWCERCAFTSRCRVADAESDLTDEERDINNEAFWRRLAANFAEAQQMLIEKADDFGIDLNAVSDEEFAAVRAREDEFIENDILAKLSTKYFKDSKSVLEKSEDWVIFSAPDEETKNEMLEIIYWYQFFAAKIRRGLHGLLDIDGNYDETELNDMQSDANGSIKIALIAVERSIMAWTVLMTDENSATIKPLINLLEIIKQKTEEKFPNARVFVRPGFDEIEIVM